jgi:hypothetical protein
MKLLTELFALFIFVLSAIVLGFGAFVPDLLSVAVGLIGMAASFTVAYYLETLEGL